MLGHLYFWIIHNRANGKNHINGKYWTYNSSRAFQELLPYWNKRQIEYILQKLKESGLIETDHHAQAGWDRTTWSFRYSLRMAYLISSRVSVYFVLRG